MNRPSIRKRDDDVTIVRKLVAQEVSRNGSTTEKTSLARPAYLSGGIGGGSTGSTTLAGLLDVALGPLSNLDYLAYDDALSKWKNAPPAWYTKSESDAIYLTSLNVADTSSIDLTYSGGTLSGVALPAGIDHNSLANLALGNPHPQYAKRARIAATELLFTDEFDRPNSATVGNNWIAAVASIFSVLGGDLFASTNDGSGFLTKFLLQPDLARDQRMSATIAGNSGGTAYLGEVLRYQSNGNHYLAHLVFTSTTISMYMYRVVSGTPTQIGATQTASYNGTDDATLNFTATTISTGTTRLRLEVDGPSAYLIEPYFQDDTESSLQGAGQSGFSVFSSTGGSTTSVTVRRVDIGRAVLGNVVFPGDSITYGENASSGQGTVTGTVYPARVMAKLGSSWKGVNLGVSGRTILTMANVATSQANANFDADCGNVVVLFGGPNDFYQKSDGDTAYYRMRRLAILWRARGYRVVVCTILPAGHPLYPADFLAKRDVANAKIRANWAQFADAIADLAADERIGVSGQQNDATYFNASDKTHPTDAGYAVIAEYVYRAIMQAVTTGETGLEIVRGKPPAPIPGTTGQVLFSNGDGTMSAAMGITTNGTFLRANTDTGTGGVYARVYLNGSAVNGSRGLQFDWTDSYNRIDLNHHDPGVLWRDIGVATNGSAFLAVGSSTSPWQVQKTAAAFPFAASVKLSMRTDPATYGVSVPFDLFPFHYFDGTNTVKGFRIVSQGANLTYAQESYGTSLPNSIGFQIGTNFQGYAVFEGWDCNGFVVQSGFSDAGVTPAPIIFSIGRAFRANMTRSSITYLMDGSNPYQIRLATGASTYVAIKPPTSGAANWAWTVPPNAGAAGQLLRTDGAGVTVWYTARELPTGGSAFDVVTKNPDGTDTYIHRIPDVRSAYNVSTTITATASETVLRSEPIANGDLRSTYAVCQVYTSGEETVGTSRIRFTFAGTTVIDTGSRAVAAARLWEVTLRIYRSSDTTARVYAKYQDSAGGIKMAHTDVTGLDWTANNDVAFRGTGTNLSDRTWEQYVIQPGSPASTNVGHTGDSGTGGTGGTGGL